MAFVAAKTPATVVSTKQAWVNRSYLKRVIAAGQLSCPPVVAGGGRAVEQLELAETIEALRVEMARAAAAGAGAEFQFPVTGVQLEFHVAVTKTSEGKAGVKF